MHGSYGSYKSRERKLECQEYIRVIKALDVLVRKQKPYLGISSTIEVSTQKLAREANLHLRQMLNYYSRFIGRYKMLHIAEDI